MTPWLLGSFTLSLQSMPIFLLPHHFSLSSNYAFFFCLTKLEKLWNKPFLSHYSWIFTSRQCLAGPLSLLFPWLQPSFLGILWGLSFKSFRCLLKFYLLRFLTLWYPLLCPCLSSFLNFILSLLRKCVLPKFICWNHDSPCDDIRILGLWEVIWSWRWCPHEWG